MTGTLSAPPDLKLEQATEIAIVSPKLTPVRPRHEDAAKLMRAVREAVRSGARAGMTSYNEIAEMLNAKGIAAPQAGRWTAQSVATALERARETSFVRLHSGGSQSTQGVYCNRAASTREPHSHAGCQIALEPVVA
jgi:Recombinase